MSNSVLPDRTRQTRLGPKSTDQNSVNTETSTESASRSPKLGLWMMQQLLKEWRQDAMQKHQYESAIFIGDKLLAITSKPCCSKSRRPAAYNCQMTTMMPSSLPKSTSPPETILAPRASLRSTTSSNEIHHVDTWPPIARLGKGNMKKHYQFWATRIQATS